MSKIFKGLFGKSGSEKRQIDFTPQGFTSSGLSGSFDKGSNSFDLTRSDELGGSLQEIVAGFRRRGEGLAALRGRATDSVTGLTRSRINRLRSARDASVGNVRAELQKRRVAGSKFGLGQVASTELAFAEVEDEIAAEGEMAEVMLEREFIVEETQAGIDAGAVMLEQLNLESSLAAGVATAATASVQANLEASAGVAESRRERNTGIVGGVLGFLLG